MPVYTAVSEVADDMQVTQHEVKYPQNAICDHIASRGIDPLFEFSDDQIIQLQKLAGDPSRVNLIEIVQLTNTWLWSSNSDFPNFPVPITIYVIQTDVSANKAGLDHTRSCSVKHDCSEPCGRQFCPGVA